MSGGATVTWSFADRTRHVAHELTWTRLSDGRTGTGSGDRLQQALPEGIATGFRVCKTMTLTFTRLDEGRIQVTAASGARSFDVVVRSGGALE